MDAIRQSGCAMAVGGTAALVEVCVNEVVSAQADALREEVGIPRNGFGERRLETRVGAITLGTPKPRGGYFPEGIVERWSRIDRALICAASEMFALGESTRKVGKVLEKMRGARLSKDRVGLICSELSAEVFELGARPAGRCRRRRRGRGPPGGRPHLRRLWVVLRQLEGLPARAPQARPGRSAARGLRRPRRHRAHRVRRGRPRHCPCDVPGGVRARFAALPRRGCHPRVGRGRCAGLPRLPRRAPQAHAYEQRPGAARQGDKAEVAGGPELPVREVFGPVGRGGVLRGMRGSVEPQVHGAHGHRGT